MLRDKEHNGEEEEEQGEDEEEGEKEEGWGPSSWPQRGEKSDSHLLNELYGVEKEPCRLSTSQQ